MSNKLLTSLIINIILIIVIIFTNVNYKNRVTDLTNQIVNKNSEINELNKTNQDQNNTLIKAVNVIKIYDFLVRDLYDSIDAPIYVYDNDTKDAFNKFYSYIKNSINPERDLIFKIGPVKKDNNDTYFVEYIIYSKLTLDKNLSQITGDMPPSLFSHHVLKYHNGKIEATN